MDTNSFWQFEHEGWERQTTVSNYHDYFGPLTQQVIEPLLDATHVKKGTKVLDLATGPGYAAGAAAKRGAQVIGTDFSAGMVQKARENYPKIRFEMGDAQDISFADNSFGAVIMNFGLLHLGDPDKSVSEAYRVLNKSGWFGFTVWAAPEEAVGFQIVLDAIRAHGTLDVDIPPAPPFFRFSDENTSRQFLSHAGFQKISFREVPQIWKFRKPGELYDAFLHGAVRTGGLLRAQEVTVLSAIREEITQKAAGYKKGSGIEIPMPAVLVSGQR